jgi:hypothetical protein
MKIVSNNLYVSIGDHFLAQSWRFVIGDNYRQQLLKRTKAKLKSAWELEDN